MHLSPSLALAALAATAAAAANPPTPVRAPAPNPDAALRPVRVRDRDPLTNAQRLARGLTPNRPRLRRGARLAPRASSAPCPSVTGTIRVTGADVAPGTLVGRVPNAFGEYGVTANASDALRVQYAACAGAGAAGHPVDLIALNGIADYAYFGGIAGFSSPDGVLAPDSSAYAYIGGTQQSPASSPPMLLPNSFTAASGFSVHTESAIWLFDSNGLISAAWVDPNGEIPEAQLAYDAASAALFLTGDLSAFTDMFGTAVPVVRLSFPFYS
ncbi:hypothetical protein WOLCODRAFT_146827 [Wolfiporia cocos MD-104 SS10]|uniref:Acid protease n=1 Tax=Wolfiporia cocos (strain MD-104) TaxID=742152 RepID=A0A2H3JJR1_WOLCO|nr:hypothetical protein WOLCODRAFT_146827 [Wolfiporia cocos MD-104 SS10]